MIKVDPKNLWFSTPDARTLCRVGSNGPAHPSQLYAIKKYVKEGMSFLDYGSGSATTYEAMRNAGIKVNYLGVDVIPKFTEWCQENYPEARFEVNPSIHKIDQPDKSWDVVYSRHVIDHMKSFEDALDEHCRVSRDLVIIVGWVPFSTSNEHQIKNIVDQGKVYENEYTNSYSKELAMKKIEEKIKEGWELLELSEDIGVEVRGHDWVIVLKRI